MPTNRTIRQRSRQAGLQSWLKYCGSEFREFCENPSWTDASAREFYNKNKAAIFLAIDARNRAYNRPFFRPKEFWQDIEAKHPRLAGEKETWRPCLEKIANSRYLNRLGLLTGWEKEIFENNAMRSSETLGSKPD